MIMILYQDHKNQNSLNMKKKTRNIKRSKHDKLVKDYDKQKEKHLEKLATKMLDKQDQTDKLKNKKINKDFLDLF